jgi:two-component system, cell cycle response regulator DivK
VETERPAVSILFVDDMASIRELYERYFSMKGLRVITAVDGRDALQLLDVERPDAIVLDLVMPRMSGWDVIRELKANARTRGIPIVAISGRVARDQALEVGADSYMQKPCAPDALLREVLRVLSEPVRRSDAH